MRIALGLTPISYSEGSDCAMLLIASVREEDPRRILSGLVPEERTRWRPNDKSKRSPPDRGDKRVNSLSFAPMKGQ